MDLNLTCLWILQVELCNYTQTCEMRAMFIDHNMTAHLRIFG